jgi:two-component system, response regulator RegA
MNRQDDHLRRSVYVSSVLEPEPDAPAGARLLIVEDDEYMRGYLQRSLEEMKFDVDAVSNYEDAILVASSYVPDHALLDIRIPGGNGLQLIQPLRALNRKMRIVLFTAYPSIASTVDAIRQGADDYLPKPATLAQIQDVFTREPSARTSSDPTATGDEAPPQMHSLARVRWEYINFVLRECDWNIAETARRLGIHRQSLQRMLKKHPPTK